jgi:hypothetical protein
MLVHHKIDQVVLASKDIDSVDKTKEIDLKPIKVKEDKMVKIKSEMVDYLMIGVAITEQIRNLNVNVEEKREASSKELR